MMLPRNDQVEIIGLDWKKFASSGVRAASKRVQKAEADRAAKLKPKLYPDILALINALGNQVVGGMFTKVVAPLNALEVAYDQVLKIKSQITPKQFMAASERVVAIREQGAKVYAVDVKGHVAIMKKWASSQDLPALTKAIPIYMNFVVWMNTKRTPYTSTLPTRAKAGASLNAAWQAMHAHWVTLKAERERLSGNIQSYQAQLLDELGLPENATMQTVESTFTSKYLGSEKKKENWAEFLADMGVPQNAAFGDIIGPMVEYIKSEKKKTFTKIAIGVGVLAAGGAALALT